MKLSQQENTFLFWFFSFQWHRRTGNNKNDGNENVIQDNFCPSFLIFLSKFPFSNSVKGQMHSHLFIFLFSVTEDKYIYIKIYIRLSSFLSLGRLTTHIKFCTQVATGSMREIRKEMEGNEGEFFFLQSEFLLLSVEQVTDSEENTNKKLKVEE